MQKNAHLALPKSNTMSALLYPVLVSGLVVLGWQLYKSYNAIRALDSTQKSQMRLLDHISAKVNVD